MPNDRVYNIEEANALLPWLRERPKRAAEAARLLEERQTVVRRLERRARGNGHHDVGGEISAAELAAVEEMRKVRTIIGTVQARGVEVRDVGTGLVDFPGNRDGRKVWLCWRMGEPEVAYWHEEDVGFDARKPL